LLRIRSIAPNFGAAKGPGNKALLKHFIDPYTGATLSPNKTHICQKQWRNMKIHMEKAKDHGYLDVDSPQVEYDYNEYKSKLN